MIPGRVFLVALALGLAAPATAAPELLASIPPLQFIAAEVMHPVARPAVLLEGLSSPHDYALRPSDLRRLRAAGLVLWVGPELEPFLQRPLGQLGADRVMSALQLPGVRRLPLATGTEAERVAGASDPHLWLDPANAAVIAHALAERLALLDAAQAALYRANAQHFAQQMTALAARLEPRLNALRDRRYLVWHGAYGYFSRRFGLPDGIAVSDHPEAGLSVQRMGRLRGLLRDEGIRCVFTEPQFAAAPVRALVAGTRARVVELDPLGAALSAEPGAYARLLENLAERFEDCLAG